jgi:hypothetical protein
VRFGSVDAGSFGSGRGHMCTWRKCSGWSGAAGGVLMGSSWRGRKLGRGRLVTGRWEADPKRRWGTAGEGLPEWDGWWEEEG